MAFNFTAFTYIIALIGDAFLIFFAIFHVIAFDELKTDYKNPIDQCNSLNPLVLPEYLLHIFLNLLFLACGEWFSLCINIPLIAYHIWRYKNRPVMSGPGLYDPTTVLSSDNLTKNMREGWIKLAIYLISFFYYIYGPNITFCILVFQVVMAALFSFKDIYLLGLWHEKILKVIHVVGKNLFNEALVNLALER